MANPHPANPHLVDPHLVRPPPIGRVIALEGASALVRLDGAGACPRLGDLVAILTGTGCCYGLVHGLRQGRRGEDLPTAELQLLGETEADGPRRFRRGIVHGPRLGDPVTSAGAEAAALAYAAPEQGGIEIGHLRRAPEIAATLAADALLGRHLAILGSTGAGKSCAVAVLLQALIAELPFARILVVDAHNEYGATFGAQALRLDPTTLELPYWLLTFEELAAILAPGDGERAYAEAAILRAAVLAAKQLAGEQAGSLALSVDTPVPYRLSDLCRAIEDAMGTLNKPEAAAAYRHLLARIAAVRDDRRYAFMFQSLVLRDNLDAILGRLLRLPVGDRPVTLLDLSGVPSEITAVVIAVLCRVIFEFGLWSEPEHRLPLLLVCEEAHRYLPREAGRGLEATRRAIDRIAREGRKYGVALCLVSQRPAELSPGSLSQCGTILALRMGNERDLDFMRNVMPDGFDWLVRELPGLGTGEAVVVGQAVRLPMQVRLTRLPAAARPSSRTPSFTAGWAKDGADAALLARTIHRWRHQLR